MFLKRGVVDENVESAEFLKSFCDGPLAELRILHISCNSQALSSFVLDSSDSFLCVRLLDGQVNDGYIGTFSCVEHRDGASYTRITAGDDGRHILKLPCPFVFWRLVLGARRHLFFDPGARL